MTERDVPGTSSCATPGAALCRVGRERGRTCPSDHVPGLLREWLGVSGGGRGAAGRGGAAAGGAGRRRAARAARGRGGRRGRADDDAMRVLRAAGKSYLDLLALRSGAVSEAPDLVVAPGSPRRGAGGAGGVRGGRRGRDPVRRRHERGGRRVRRERGAMRGAAASPTSAAGCRLAVDLVDGVARRVRRPGMRLPELDAPRRRHGLHALGDRPRAMSGRPPAAVRRPARRARRPRLSAASTRSSRRPRATPGSASCRRWTCRERPVDRLRVARDSARRAALLV